MTAFRLKPSIQIICLLIMTLVGCSKTEIETPTNGRTSTVISNKPTNKWPEHGTPGFKVFFCDYRTGKDVNSKNAELHEIPKIERMMREILNSTDNFIGVIDQSDRTLQFIANDDGSIQIDIPDPVQKGSMVKNAKIEECVLLIHEAGPSIADLNIPGLKFETW